MPELRLFQPSWLDKEFKKAFRKLPRPEQKRRERQLGDLLEALADSSHPATDPRLQAWRPSGYRGVVSLPAGFRLVEYRFPGLMRVVAAYVERSPGESIDWILLLVATLKHDHERLKRLLRQHGRDLGNQNP